MGFSDPTRDALGADAEEKVGSLVCIRTKRSWRPMNEIGAGLQDDVRAIALRQYERLLRWVKVGLNIES